jgi:hypothetical protein
LREIYQALIKLRKQYPAFRNDRVLWLHNSDEANLVTFMRPDDNDEFVIVINFSNRPITGRVEVAHDCDFKPVRIAGMPEAPPNGFPSVRLNGFDWRIYHRAAKQVPGGRASPRALTPRPKARCPKVPGLSVKRSPVMPR